MTTTEVATLKRTELQAAACRQFGKGAAAWTGRATNEELREALTSGEVPAEVRQWERTATGGPRSSYRRRHQPADSGPAR